MKLLEKEPSPLVKKLLNRIDTQASEIKERNNRPEQPIKSIVPKTKVGITNIQNDLFKDYNAYKQTPKYTNELGETKPLKTFNNTSIGMKVNTYEDFLKSKGFINNKIASPSEADRYRKEYDNYIKKLSPEQQKKFLADKNSYDANKSIELASKQVQNPANVALHAAVNSATLGLADLNRKNELSKQQNTNPLYSLQLQDAIQMGKQQNPKAEMIGNIAGSLLPYGVASKALSPITKPIVNKLGGGLLGNIVEGAISGAIPDAIQSVVQNEGNLSNLPKDVLTGAAQGAVFDVGSGLLRNKLNLLSDTKSVKPVTSKAVDTKMQNYLDNGILPGKSISSVKPIETPIKQIEPNIKPIDLPKPKPGPKTLVPNQTLNKLEQGYKENINAVKNSNLNPQEKSSKSKALGMQYAAEKRNAIQGDSPKPVDGGLTPKELQNKIKKEQGNYYGKNVTVDGKNAIVVANPYGKVKVKFDDGTFKTVAKESVIPKKYNTNIETKIKTASNNTNVGTLGDYLQGEQIRELYKPVLDTPIRVTDSNTIVNGALGKVNGKSEIIINKNVTNIEDTILEEASHAMRENKGRSNLGLSGIDEAKTNQYETLPYEKSAGKMVEYSKTLDIPGQSGQKKNFKLIESVKKADQFSNEIKTNIKGEYEVKGNDQLIRDADALIRTDPERAMRLAKSESINSDLSNEVSRQLIQKAQKEGRWNDAIELTETTARKAMESGRAVQALSLWSKMTPEGMLKYAQQMIDKANAKFAQMNPKEFEKIKNEYKKMGIDIKYYSLNPRQSKMAKIIQLTPGDAKYINTQMVKIDNMADGRKKDIEVAKTLDYIAAKIPPTMLQKVSTLQTMAQLLNAKTAIRNVLGNAGFQVLEGLSDTLGTGIDKLISTVTKERTKYLPSIGTQMKGFGKGFKLGLEDALLGIDTSNVKTQLDLPNRTFRKGFFGALEKVMNIELRASDQAFYQAAFDQSLRNQMRSKGIKNIQNATNEMLEQAHLDGLYRTFQDKNALSNIFTGLKRVLNNGKEFGFGDMILKYPKTPANLLMRGVDYSPLGIVKGLYSINKNGFDQKKFVENLSRATIGSTLLGSGVLLYNLGIITGKSPKDKEASMLMQETGKGQYSINISALKRFMLSGLNPEYAKTKEGDTLINYDWIQPGALPLTAGTNIAEQNKSGKVNPGDVLGALVYSFESGVDTLAEQPLVQNATKFLRGYNSLSESIMGTFKDVPASFVPTFVNQVRQLTDNISRETKSDEYFGTKEALNRVINKLPFLSKFLDERVTTTGQTKSMYQNNSNNFLNVFLNPAFTSQYDTSPGMKLVLDLYERTGQTKQFPRVLSNQVTIKKKTYQLTPEQKIKYQKELGQKVLKRLDRLNSSTNDEANIKKIVNILDEEADKLKKRHQFDIKQNPIK